MDSVLTAATETAWYSTLLVTLLCFLGFHYLLGIVSRVSRIPQSFGLLIFVWYTVASVLALEFGWITHDARIYDLQAATLAERWGAVSLGTRQLNLTEGKEGFPVILGIIYSLGGRVPMGGAIFNAGVTALTAVIIAVVARNVYGTVSLNYLLLFFLSWPVFLTMAPGLLREPLCWLGISIYALGVSRWKSSRLTSASLILVSVGLLWWVRTPLAMVVVVGLTASVLFVVARSMLGRVGIAIYGALSFVSLLVMSSALLQASGNDQERLEIVRSALSSRSNSAYSVSAGPLISLFGDAGFIIANIPHILFGPFPWELGPNAVWLFVLASAVHWWFLLGGVWWVIRNKGADNITLVLVITALVMLVGMSASLTNYGIVVRGRGLPAILILIVVAGHTTALLPAWLQRARSSVAHEIPRGSSIGESTTVDAAAKR